MVKYLTFDCYGTLIDWKAGIESSFRKYFLLDLAPDQRIRPGDIFQNYVELESREEAAYAPYSEILARTSSALAKEIGIEEPEEASKKFAASITTWPAFEDTKSALKQLGDLGYMRYILSNIERATLKETISANGLEIDGFVTAEDVNSYKPQTQHWLYFLESVRAEKSDVIHVAGSLYHDIAPASRLGLKTIWVNRYGETRGSNDAEPIWTVNSLSDVVAIVSTFQ